MRPRTRTEKLVIHRGSSGNIVAETTDWVPDTMYGGKKFSAIIRYSSSREYEVGTEISWWGCCYFNKITKKQLAKEGIHI